MKEKTDMQHLGGARGRRREDGLGPNSDIGMKLRALYGAVQNESIPDRLLDLLDKLDEVERQSKPSSAQD